MVIGWKLFYVIEELKICAYIMIYECLGEDSLALVVDLTYCLAPSSSIYMDVLF